MRLAALLSALLHVAVALALLAATLAMPTSAPNPTPSEAVVEMILKAPGSNSASATGARDPQSPAQQAADLASPPTPPTPPAPTPPDAAAEPSPAPAPSPAKPSPTPASAAPAAVRLGDGGPEGLTDDISGDIPASPDPSSPNLPPRYPAEAARRGQQGAVILTVTIAPNGATSAVQIARSSGHALLDSAAQQAVARWHFKPGLDAEGSPVSSSMPIRIRFVLD